MSQLWSKNEERQIKGAILRSGSNGAKLTVCPECGSKLRTIVYGMLAGDPRPDFVVGGRMVDSSSPSKACSKCEWRGGEPEIDES